jgi:uncharacterized protein Smg (DUF494 family)
LSNNSQYDSLAAQLADLGFKPEDVPSALADLREQIEKERQLNCYIHGGLPVRKSYPRNPGHHINLAG